MDDPNGVTLDASLNLYVADSGNNRVREVNVSTADISTYAGNGNTIVDNGDGGPSDIAWLLARPTPCPTPRATSTSLTAWTTGSRRSLRPTTPSGASP